MKFNRTLLLLFLVLAISFSSCKKKEENPQDDNESELITTVKLKFTEGGVARTFTFRDLDGAGGNTPVIDGINLNNGRTYTMEIELLDESNPAKVVDITDEIEEEADEHQFFFTGSAVANLLTITYDDKDKSNRPLGLKNRVVTRSTGTGQLTVTLRHRPNKGASGVANGQIANAGGETDIEVTFNVTIQ